MQDRLVKELRLHGISKAIHCLLYQCHEGKVHESRLYDELNHAAGELAQRIVQDLPEYDKASWGD